MTTSPISNIELKNYVVVYKKQICPFPVFLVVPGYNKFMKKYLGFPLAKLIVLIDNGMWAGHIDMKNWRDAKEKMLALYHQNPKIIDEFAAKLKQSAKEFLKFTSSLKNNLSKPKNDFSKHSGKELAALYKRYCNEYISSYIYSEPAPNLLKDALEEKLKGKLMRILKNEAKLNKVFSLLTIPSVLDAPFPEDSFVIREEKDLLKIAVLAKKKEINVTENSEETNIIENMLKNHTEKYAWVPVDYNGEPWTITNFKKRLNDLLSDNINPQKKLKTIVDAPENLKKEQLAIKKEYNIDDDTFFDCITAQKCMAAMDIKKEVCSTSHYHAQFLMREIAKRLKLTPMQANYLTPNEVELALTDKNKRKKFTKKLLDDRYQQSCYIGEGVEVNFLNKDEEKVVRKIIEKAPESQNKLTGICGNPGYVKGKARVILETKDFHKMQKGEILVTSFTTPEFVVVMKKSTGILTDMGSITSHSSIVARELNIPCVVGTKFATKLIKDGDVIEMDAGNGVIRIIKQ